MSPSIENLYSVLKYALEKRPFLVIFTIIFAGIIYVASLYFQGNWNFAQSQQASLLQSQQEETLESIQELQRQIEALRRQLRQLDQGQENKSIQAQDYTEATLPTMEVSDGAAMTTIAPEESETMRHDYEHALEVLEKILEKHEQKKASLDRMLLEIKKNEN